MCVWSLKLAFSGVRGMRKLAEWIHPDTFPCRHVTPRVDVVCGGDYTEGCLLSRNESVLSGERPIENGQQYSFRSDYMHQKKETWEIQLSSDSISFWSMPHFSNNWSKTASRDGVPAAPKLCVDFGHPWLTLDFFVIPCATHTCMGWTKAQVTWVPLGKWHEWEALQSSGVATRDDTPTLNLSLIEDKGNEYVQFCLLESLHRIMTSQDVSYESQD